MKKYKHCIQEELFNKIKKIKIEVTLMKIREMKDNYFFVKKDCGHQVIIDSEQFGAVSILRKVIKNDFLMPFIFSGNFEKKYNIYFGNYKNNEMAGTLKITSG